MGQSFSFFNEPPEAPESTPPSEMEWDGEKVYEHLVKEVRQQSEKNPYDSEFTVEIPRNLPTEAIEKARKKAQEYGWKVEIQGTNVRLSLPVSQSAFLPKSEYNPSILYETVVREVTKLVRTNPYVNKHEVKIPVSFMKSFNEEENTRRETVRTTLFSRLEGRGWKITVSKEDLFCTILTIQIPPSLPH